MELPSYSRQLLQQLYTLCKEQQFCDCTIFIGNVHFRAHKVVLAAASLLFKSLLDSTDTISIDSAMVSPEEFAVLLEMMYSGNLPPGKHNFTKVISMADNLQMFDVAVSCKNLLRDLISSTQDQVVREAPRQATDSSGNHTEANNLPQPEKNDETKADIPIPWRVSPFPDLAEAKMEADVSLPGQQLDVNHTWVQQDMMLGDSRSLQEDSGSSPEHPAPAEQGGCAEQGLAEPLEEKGGVRDLAEESKSCELDFLLCYESVFSEALSDARDVLKRLEECREMDASQKEALAACLGTTGEESVFRKLLKEGMDAQSLDATTLVSFLKLFGDTNPKVRAALLAREQVRGETLQQTESPDKGGTLTARLLGCKEQLIQTVTHLSPITEFLEAAEEGFLTALEKRIISDCCEGGSQREVVDKLLSKVDEEKTLRAESLVKLLGAVKGSFPGLHLLLNNLVATANVSDDKAKWSPEDYGAELLRQHRERLVGLLTDTQLLLQGISAAQSLAPAEKEVMEQVVKAGGFSALVAAVLEEERSLSVSAVWQLLLAMREPAPLNLLMEEIQKQPGAEFFFQSVVSREITAIEIILRHSKLISEAIQQRVDLEALVPGEAGLTEAVKELLSISAQKESSEASLKAALSTAQEKSVPAIKICQLLCNVHEFFPDLQPVMQELGHMGFLTERSEEKPGIKKWKVNSESQVEALDKDEDKVGDASTKKLKKPQGKDPSSQSFVCKACEKTFRFSCRLRAHLKHCRAAWGRQSRCQQCSEVCPTKEELEKHQLEVHGVVATAKKKKKKRRPVVCNICGRQFAHTSGMQYHKLTEHYDKKPFSCKECGAKFAANSTLKNHLRLHTGDRPFVCKHCPMTFMQASALAYHTKKKHAEGKMYSCQQCHAVFAQSVELSRHNRTHTGDKPYVCRECGKGFTKANGLSGHLRTFHADFKDPYNCKKCRVSFPTPEEHRQHVHTAHPRACHPCPSCPKVFSAPSLLERHMVTHDGGKPFSCDICDKAYQQLSGLWYHNRTHHPDVFAAQNHRSSTFSPLQCSFCHKTFCSTAAHQKHVRAEHKGALQNCVTRKHFEQSENTFTCELCRELFPTQGELEGHYSAEHPKVVFSQPTTAQIVQVTQTVEQDAAEDLISFDDARLAGSQVFVTLPESQGSQTSTELVAVTMEDLFDDKVTLVREEIKCE